MLFTLKNYVCRQFLSLKERTILNDLDVEVTCMKPKTYLPDAKVAALYEKGFESYLGISLEYLNIETCSHKDLITPTVFIETPTRAQVSIIVYSSAINDKTMEWCTTDDGKYRIESLSAATFTSAIKVIKDALCQDENVCMGTEINKNSIAAEELLELGADAALDGVSVVAVDTESGAVAAVAINKIQIKTADELEKPFFVTFAEKRCTQASSRTLVNFMADVEERCNLFEKYNVDCSFEMMFLATLRNHRKRGLAKLLIKVSIDIAKKMKDGPVSPLHIRDLGPKYSHLTPHKTIATYPKICQAILTGTGSQRIGKDLDFTVHLTVPFTEFSFNGKTFSDRIGDETAFCEVAALSL